MQRLMNILKEDDLFGPPPKTNSTQICKMMISLNFFIGLNCHWTHGCEKIGLIRFDSMIFINVQVLFIEKMVLT